MFKHLSISMRIGLAFSVVMLLAVGTLLAISQYRLDSTIGTAEQRELAGLFKSVNAAIAMESRSAEMMSDLVANIPEVNATMAAGDRDKLARMMVPAFDVLKKDFGVRQFQFHTPPATSFLRVHKPEKFGDDLSSFRHTVVDVNTKHEPVVGLEKGVAGLGLRGVVPVNHDGKQIGSVEFGLSFGKPFFENFKKLYGVDLALHVQDNNGFKVFASTLDNNASMLTADQLTTAFSGKALKEQEYYHDTPVAVYAGVVNDFSGNPIGVLEIVMDRSQYVQSLNRSAGFNMAIGAVFLVFGVIIAIFLSRAIVRPLKKAVAAMNDVAEGDGDLTQRLEAGGSKEISELADAFNRFAEKVQILVTDVASSTGRLAAAAEEMSIITSESNTSISRQRSEIDMVATAMNEMTATVQEVARSAAEAAKSAKDADAEASQGRSVVNQAMTSINALAQEVEGAAEVINRLQADSEAIGTVLDVIRGIAEQTNLLALNAAIEAARAGEQGRGFAVVADEVRTLASRTQKSTQEIHDMIERLQSGSREAVSVMQAGRTRAEESVSQAQSASVSLDSITQSVARIYDMNAQIASAAEEQSAVSEEINRNVVNINDVADQVTQGAAQTATAGSELAHLASDLQNMIGRFKIQ
ncbi:MAG: HAMP domain-containing protein [Gammaproteobacteria bacterium]|nr:HAMP domain-containing protein [Gammaproteobacteria bacterium]